MNTRKAIWAGIIAGCVVACANILIMTATKPTSAEMAAAKFCRAVVADSDWRAKMIMTDDLKAQWRAAEKQNAAIQRANPGEKPPLGDGVQLASFPDAMPECVVGKVAKRADSTVVSINRMDPANPSANWTDRIVVKQVGNAWLIDDIQFPSHGNGLRTALGRVINMPVPESEIAADEPVAQPEPAAGQPEQPQETIQWNQAPMNN